MPIRRVRAFLPHLLVGGFVIPAAPEACAESESTRSGILAANYTGELWSDDQGRTEYLDNLDLTFELEGEQWSMFAYGLYNNGASVGRLIDTAQGISNIESDRHFRIYEAWGEWRLASTSLSVRAGLYDVNSEFDAIERAALFINPSHGMGVDFSQTGHAGPSIFPLTSLAVRVEAELGSWRMRMAVLDAHPEAGDRFELSSDEGALVVGEANYALADEWRVAFGYWHYSARFESSETIAEVGASDERRDNAGAYALAEGPLWTNEEGDREVGAFFRIGQAEDRVNAVQRYVGAGIIATGLLKKRADDTLGFAVATANPGATYRRTSERRLRSENIFEVTYRMVVTDWLTLQSDVQYVRNPAFGVTTDSDWIFGLRVELGLTCPCNW